MRRASTASWPAREAPLVDAIVRAADEVLGRRPRRRVSAVGVQTGSGTQTNMNMNEVLANRASELLGGQRAARRAGSIPTDHVNLASRPTT